MVGMDMRPTDPGEILSIQQVAEITGLAVKTLRNLRAKGEGPPMWVLRGRVRCYRSDLDAWITAERR